MGGPREKVDRLKPVGLPLFRQGADIPGQGRGVAGEIENPEKRPGLGEKFPGIRTQTAPRRIDQADRRPGGQTGQSVLQLVLKTPLQQLRKGNLLAKGLHRRRVRLDGHHGQPVAASGAEKNPVPAYPSKTFLAAAGTASTTSFCRGSANGRFDW